MSNPFGSATPLNDLYSSSWLSAPHPCAYVGGRFVMMDNQAAQWTNTIGQRSTCSFTYDDLIGSIDVPPGTSVTILNDGSQNLLTDDQSELVASAGGFSAIGSPAATFSRVLSPAPALGTATLQVVCDGTGSQQGVTAFVPVAELLTTGSYVVSVYLRGDGVTPLWLWITDNAFNVVAGPVTVLPPSGAWQRFALPFTLPNTFPVGTTGYNLNISTTSTPAATTFYASALQWEADTMPSNWHAGGTTLGTTMFEGVAIVSTRSRYGLSAVYPMQVQGSDYHYHVDKRIVAATYQSRTCGYMLKDLINTYFSQEGITYQRGVNLFDAEQSSWESSSGISTEVTAKGLIFTSGVTVSQDISQSFFGSASLKVTTDGSATFQDCCVSAPASSFIPGETYIFSAYLKWNGSGTAPTLRFYCQANDQAPGNTSIGSAGTITLTTSWQRYFFAVTMPTSFANGGNPFTIIGLRVDTSNALLATTYWLDGLQVEQCAATPWVTGGTGANLLTAEQADFESAGLAGVLVTGSGTTALTQDTTDAAWNGSACLKIVTDGTAANQGVKLQQTVDGRFSPGGILSASAYMMATSGTPTVILEIRANNLAVLLGTITVTLTNTWTRYDIAAILPSPLTYTDIEIRAITNGSVAQTWLLDGAQLEMLSGSAPTAWELGGTAKSIYDGPVVDAYNANWVQGSKPVDDFAQYASYYWYVDSNKVMWFLPIGTQTAPFTYDGTQGVYGSQTVDHQNTLYRNAQWLLNVPSTTAQQTDTRTGDGSTRAYAMSYPFNQVPTVTVLGATQTVGIKGVDDQTHSKHWYWSKGDSVLAQETNDTPLSAVYQNLIATGATAGTFTVTYKGVTSATINWNDSAATIQTKLQAMSSIGSGNALCSGGPLPSSAVTIQFAAALATDKSVLTIGTNSLTGGTPVLSAVSPLVVTYIGQWVSNIYVPNNDEIANQQAIEGTGSSGTVEEAHQDNTVLTQTQAFQLANALLNRYGQQAKQIQFTTRVAGLAPGQLLPINPISPGWLLGSTQALIEQMQCSFAGNWVEQQVTAIIGPYNANWVQWFQRLANYGGVVQGNAGSSQTVQLTELLTAAWNWAANLTATVYSCPIVGPTTLCGPTRVVC